jgi:NADH-quinone oxidoreductase subunit J
MTVDLVFFLTVGCVAIVCAVMMVLARNPVTSALFLIANFFCLAALYLLLRAQLLAALQIVVYTGAIMVLVVFVIMLLNLGEEERVVEKYNLRTLGAGILGAGLVLELLFVLFGPGGGSPAGPTIHPDALAVGTVEAMGTAMFTRFVFPFEITSLLLLAAIIGAVVMAKKGGSPA